MSTQNNQQDSNDQKRKGTVSVAHDAYQTVLNECERLEARVKSLEATIDLLRNSNVQLANRLLAEDVPGLVLDTTDEAESTGRWEVKTLLVGAANGAADAMIAAMKNEGWDVAHEQVCFIEDDVLGSHQRVIRFERLVFDDAGCDDDEAGKENGITFEMDIGGDNTPGDAGFLPTPQPRSMAALDARIYGDPANIDNWADNPLRQVGQQSGERDFSEPQVNPDWQPPANDEPTQPIPDVEEADIVRQERKTIFDVDATLLQEAPGEVVYGAALPDALVTLPDDAPDTLEEAAHCAWLTAEQRTLIARREQARAGERAAAKVDAWFERQDATIAPPFPMLPTQSSVQV